MRAYPTPISPDGGLRAELRELLRSHGCRLERQGKGDHQIWWSPITKRHFVVDGKIKSRHTANAVLKQAGIEKTF